MRCFVVFANHACLEFVSHLKVLHSLGLSDSGQLRRVSSEVSYPLTFGVGCWQRADAFIAALRWIFKLIILCRYRKVEPTKNAIFNRYAVRATGEKQRGYESPSRQRVGQSLREQPHT